MSDQDYYDILGVRRNATDGDIKKAYKKQAMKWHPDRNIKNRYDAEKRFKEVSEAYQVLIDPDKRKIYDKYGKDGLDDTFAFNPDNGFPGFDFEPAQNIFAELFGEQVFPEMFEEETFEGIPTGNYYFTQNIHHNKDSKLKPAEYDLPCTLEELYKGKERSFKITRRGLLGPETRVLKIDVKPGWKEGTKITFASEGDIVLNHPPRDVVFIVKENPHKDFKRKGNDLVIRIKISLNQALTGCTKRVKIITGSYKMVKVPRLKSSTETKIIKGLGMPIRKNGQFRGYGDLIVKFDIILD